MVISFYTLTDNSEAGSMTDKKTEKKSIFTKGEINAGITTSSGWKTFIKSIETSYGTVKTINIATELTDEELNSCCNYMECLTNNNIDGFFRLYFSSGVEVGAVVDEFRVFSFAMDVDVYPLTSISPDEKKRDALSLYKEIIRIISAYKKSNMFINGQMPLNCICEDSIYLSINKDKAHIKILPMVNKKKMNDRDINIDLYDAAYLYFKLRYPNGESFENNETDQFIERSLSPFKSQQPTLEEIENFFGISSPGDHGIINIIRKTTDDNTSTTSKDIPNKHDKDKKESNDYLKSIVRSALNRFKDFVFGKMSDISSGSDDDDGTIEK